MDPSAYDHLLFLSALTLPFSFKSWKKVLVLATVFTIAHCTSLALSAFDVVHVAVGWIEFLIPVTILITALYNYTYISKDADEVNLRLQLFSTAFFGLIHGFGFSNYFNMLMGGVEEKLLPLTGFAAGIELAQLAVITLVLLLATLVLKVFHLKKTYFIVIASLIVALLTIPMLLDTFPW
jgi:hypothetical protein